MLHQEVPHLQTLHPPQTHPQQANKLSITLPSPILPLTGTTSQHLRWFCWKTMTKATTGTRKITFCWNFMKFLSSSSSSSSSTSSSASSKSGSTPWYSGWKSFAEGAKVSHNRQPHLHTKNKIQLRQSNCIIVYPLLDICEAFSCGCSLHSLCCPSSSAGIRLGKCECTLNGCFEFLFCLHFQCFHFCISIGFRSIFSSLRSVPSQVRGERFLQRLQVSWKQTAHILISERCTPCSPS